MNWNLLNIAGSLYFGNMSPEVPNDKDFTEVQHTQTHGVLHRGRHRHGAMPIEDGERWESQTVKTSSINAQCRSKSWHWSEIPLNADHCQYIKSGGITAQPKHLIFTTRYGQVLPLVDFLELLMTIADQCRSILTDIAIPMPINTDQCQSLLINARSIILDPALICIDRNREELIGIGINAAILIRTFYSCIILTKGAR